MVITPITLNNDFTRYKRLDNNKVLDTVMNKVYNTDNSDDLINKLNNVGKINANIIEGNTTGKLLTVNV